MPQRPVTPAEIVAAKAQSPHMQVLGGFLWARILDDGRCVYLAKAPTRPGRLLLGIAKNIDVKVYDAAWEYEPGDAAWRAAIGWDGHGEPECPLCQVAIPRPN